MQQYKVSKKKTIIDFTIIAILGQALFILIYSRDFSVHRNNFFIALNVLFIIVSIFYAIKQLQSILLIKDNSIIYKDFRMIESVDVSIPISQIHAIKKHKYNDISNIFIMGIEVKSQFKSVVIPINMFQNYIEFIEILVNETKDNKKIKVDETIYDIIKKSKE